MGLSFSAMAGEDNDDRLVERLKVVIVGAGIAGLTCARELLASQDSLDVQILEASDTIGGRMQRVSSPLHNGVYLDAGAEFVHGRGHVLWETILDYQRRGLLPKMVDRNQRSDEGISDRNKLDEEATPFEFQDLEPYFILSHADGGPEEEPTPQGKFGMYFVDNELLMHNDPKVQPLAEALETIMSPEKAIDYTCNTSIADALAAKDVPILDESLMQLCVAGYGNTAGCSDLSQLSVQQLLAFEHYWEENEIEGDYRPLFGLYRIPDAMLDDIQTKCKANSRFELRLKTPVDRIRSRTASGNSLHIQGITIECANDFYPQEESADIVVITVPPTRLPALFDHGRDLPVSKQEALARIGFADRIIKVICAFREDSFWPANVQSIIAAGQPIPEMWIRSLGDIHVIVGYLVSDAANDFIHLVQAIQELNPNQTKEHAAAMIMIQQLSTMLKVQVASLEVHWISEDTKLVDWQVDYPHVRGGYMFAKTGMRPGMDLAVLAEPMMNGRLLFAGECTNTNACCTVQAAMETGYRAAKQVGELRIRIASKT